MMLRRIFWIALLGAILSPLLAAPEEKQDTLFYEVKVKNRWGNAGTRKMYKRGPDFEFLTDSGGLKVRFVKNRDGQFIIHPHRKIIGQYQGDDRKSPMVFLPGPAGDVKAFLAANKAKKVGREKVGNKVCDKYSYVENETKWKCELWVDPKTYTPAKLTMIGDKKENTTIVTYVSYQRGVKISDFHFELPKDYAIRPMPASDKLRAAAESGALKAPEPPPGEQPEKKSPPRPTKEKGYASPAPTKPGSN